MQPGDRPAALQWVLLQAGLLVAAACVVLLLGVLPALGHRAAWLAVLAGLLAAVAVARWPSGDGGLGGWSVRRPHLAALGVALVLAWALRGLPALESVVPLGYDYGFYKAVFDAYAAGPFPLRSQPDWMASQFEPGLPALHAVLQGVAGLSSHDHLRVLHPVLAAANALFAFVVVRGYGGTRLGLVAAALMAGSALQVEANAYLYEKNLVALGLLLVALFLLHRRAWLACGLLLGAIGAWHRPTLLLAALGFAVAVLADPGLRPLWRGWARTAALAVALFLPIWIAMPETFLTVGLDVAEASGRAIATGDAESSGTFFPLHQGARLMAPYLPLAIAAAVIAWRQPPWRTPVLVAAIAFSYVALELPLNRRFLLMADALAILAVGAALAPLAGRRAMALAAACVVLTVGLGASMAMEPSVPHRFLTEEQWHELAVLHTLPGNATVVADNLRAPYVMAELGGRTYGPGLFDDVHDRGDWQRFWGGLSGDDLRAFMAPYGSPAYMVQVDEPGPDWGAASLREPAFTLVHDASGLRVWHYKEGSA